ncbi:hypothetical protein BGZ98_003365 [Dissophora globulifera]|nr:hypothetical protein BGZ98_003365 [Dissophora globulifera]
MSLPQPVELAWLALISCSPQSLDQLLSATKFGASAVIFYASQLQGQHQCRSLLVNNTPSSIPVFVLDTDLTTLQLALFLENVHNGSMVARVAIAATKGDLSPFSDAPCPHKDAKIREDQPIVPVATDVATDDVHRRQDTRCDTLEFLAELVRSGATLAKNTLHRWRLCGSTKMRRTSPLRTEMERTATAEAVAIELDTSTAAVKEKGMVSTNFLPLQTLSRVDPQITTQSGHGLDKREDAINQPVTAATALQRPSGAIARKRIPALERVYIRHHHHSGRQTPAQRLVQRIHSFSVSKFVQDTAVLVRADSMAGKLAMVLMSTVCGVGVGMFGALLFVVALKVRLFQTRRRGHQQHGHHVTEHPMHGHQPMQGTVYKRVIPQVVLESFGIQTVLHTSTTAMVTTVVVKPDLAALTRVKLRYANDEIEMEEGLEDVVARENARRQRNRSRANALFPRATGLDAPDADMHVAVRDADWVGVTEREVMEQIGESTTLLPSQGVSETTAMDMERITAAIMNVTRRGSYRRIPQSRTMRQDGQETNDELLAPLSRTTSVSLSLSTTLSAGSANGKHGRCATGEDHGDGDKDDEDVEEKEEKLPFANANAQTMCSICLVEYEVGDQLRTLPCYHQYHMVCIDPWLLTIASLCPICKRDLWPAPC